MRIWFFIDTLTHSEFVSIRNRVTWTERNHNNQHTQGQNEKINHRSETTASFSLFWLSCCCRCRRRKSLSFYARRELCWEAAAADTRNQISARRQKWEKTIKFQCNKRTQTEATYGLAEKEFNEIVRRTPPPPPPFIQHILWVIGLLCRIEARCCEREHTPRCHSHTGARIASSSERSHSHNEKIERKRKREWKKNSYKIAYARPLQIIKCLLSEYSTYPHFCFFCVFARFRLPLFDCFVCDAVQLTIASRFTFGERFP